MESVKYAVWLSFLKNGYKLLVNVYILSIITASSLKIIRFFLFSCIPLFFSSGVWAQLQGQPLLDSLIKQLPYAPNDTFKLAILSDISFGYKSIDPVMGLKYCRQEMDIATELKSKKAIAVSYRDLGCNYQFMSDYPRALDNFYKALNIFDELHMIDLYGETIGNIANVFQAQGNYKKALEYDLKSLDIDTKMKLKGNIAGDMGNIGNIYMSLSNYDEALKYDFKSLEIFKELGNKNGIANNLGNIANVYSAQGKFEESLDNNFQALSVFNELGDRGGISLTMGNIGSEYAQIAQDTTGQIKAGKWIQASKATNLQKSVEYLTNSIEISKAAGQLDNIIEFSKDLSEADVFLGNYKGALENYQ